MAKKVTKEKIKENISEKAKKSKKEASSLFKEFKKFISRGNVVDMSIGVVIGTAFGAIVTALTNIFLNLATWGVPGGLNGLITVLPALNSSQAGMTEIGQCFNANDLNVLAKKLFEMHQSESTYSSISDARSVILSKYTLHGGTYVSNGAAMINWGAMINAVLSFLVIALVLFVILKTFAKFNELKEKSYKKIQEEYYKKHPEKRPAPVDPKEPELNEKQLLKQILIELKEINPKKKETDKSVKKK